MKELALEKAFLFIEPGPLALVSTFNGKKNNIMPLSWITVKEWTPEFIMVTGPWNYSYSALVKNKECVIAVPAADIAKKAVQAGSCSGKDTDKFAKFGFTPLKAASVKAPLIKECLVNIECKVTDHIKKHGIFVLEGINAWIDEKKKEKKLLHAVGDGTFIVDGKKIDLKKVMKAKIPPGV